MFNQVIDAIMEHAPKEKQMTLIMAYLELSIHDYENKKADWQEKLMHAKDDAIDICLNELERIEKKMNKILIFKEQIETGTLPEPAPRPDLDAMAKEEP